jgi:hypothetical protein
VSVCCARQSANSRPRTQQEDNSIYSLAHISYFCHHLQFSNIWPKCSIHCWQSFCIRCLFGQPTHTFEPWLTSTAYRIPVMATGEPLSEHAKTVLERGTVLTLIPSNLSPNPTASMIRLPYVLSLHTESLSDSSSPRGADSSDTGSALDCRIDQIPAIPSNVGSTPTGPLLKPGPLYVQPLPMKPLSKISSHRDVFPSITTSVLERRTEVVTLIPTPSNLSPNPGIVLIRP